MRKLIILAVFNTVDSDNKIIQNRIATPLLTLCINVLKLLPTLKAKLLQNSDKV